MTRHSPNQSGDRVFYVTDDVKVTENWLIIGKRRMLIRELKSLHIVRAAASRMPLAIAVAGLLLPAVAGMVGLDSTVAWVVVGLGTVVALGVAATVHRGESPPMVLHAEYRGVNAPIYWNDDERVFGQVTRALLRAKEMPWRPEGFVDVPAGPSES